jgi:hypothetical protein
MPTSLWYSMSRFVINMNQHKNAQYYVPYIKSCKSQGQFKRTGSIDGFGCHTCLDFVSFCENILARLKIPAT